MMTSENKPLFITCEKFPENNALDLLESFETDKHSNILQFYLYSIFFRCKTLVKEHRNSKILYVN